MEDKRNSSTSSTIISNITRPTEIKVEKLTLEDRTVKRNIRYLMCSLSEKDDRRDFEKQMGIDSNLINKYTSIDRNIMPPSDIICAMERFFEGYLAVAPNSINLADKTLVSKVVVPQAIGVRDITLIKNNIRNLREYHTETQDQLARAIGVKPNAISNYENPKNDRLPDQEILLKIAKHYRITVDQLIYQEFLFNPLLDVPVNDEDVIGNVLEDLLPFIDYGDEVAEDEKNNKCIMGLRIHEDLFEFVLNSTITDHIDELEKMMGLYKQAIAEGDGIALCNHLWWLMYFGIGFFSVNDQMLKHQEEVLDCEASVSDILKIGMLFDFTALTGEMQDLQQYYLNTYEELIIQDIFTMKQAGFNELADYYNALRYLFGIIRNDLTKELNRVVGQEMMRSLFLMGNSYVRDFYSIRNALTIDD